MAHPPDDAGGQQVRQGSVNRGVRLAQDARQFRRIDERRLAEWLDIDPRTVASRIRAGRFSRRMREA